MFACEKCSIELVVEGLPPGRLVRCVKCEGLSHVQTVDPSNRFRRAWWSLWLGSLCIVFGFVAVFAVSNRLAPIALAAVILMFVLGCVSIYFAVKSLLQMRYVQASKGTRFAAIFGSILGLTVGVFAGGLFSAIGMIAAMAFMTTDHATGPDEALPVANKIATIDFPADLNIVPHSAHTAMFTFAGANFRDHEEVDSGTVHLEVVKWPQWIAGSNPPQFQDLVKNADYMNRYHRSASQILETKPIKDWNLQGANQTMLELKRVYTSTVDDSKTELKQYYSIIDFGTDTIGVTLIFDPATNNLSEEIVRQIFESIGPPED